MFDGQHKIHPFAYQGGKDITQRLEKALKTKGNMGLAKVLGISRATISTWHQRNQTPFEVVVRVHLATGASLKWLILGEGEMYVSDDSNAGRNTVNLPYFSFKDGDLVEEEKLQFDRRYLESKRVLVSDNLIVVAKNGDLVFVDKSFDKAISGQYLIKIDGDVSINSLQKLPGNKVAIEFSNSTVQLDERDIEVLGKVISN
ncbi:phage repressor protein CI [Photobacterium sp. CAU 1568]|uniref:Phage repressor protein CI n=1 Tax=Photobacterium arenosum TaxID=2774143 RepID=A0ABR9BRL2_9GAMM|nr:phage repressor protein CI [Photobacterium arenosum]MBD8515193.1 phage repressor protein CI [Photobacterium arenosum]